MTALGNCQECGRVTGAYVEGIGWLCRECDPLTDIRKPSSAQPGPSHGSPTG